MALIRRETMLRDVSTGHTRAEAHVLEVFRERSALGENRIGPTRIAALCGYSVVTVRRCTRTLLAQRLIVRLQNPVPGRRGVRSGLEALYALSEPVAPLQDQLRSLRLEREGANETLRRQKRRLHRRSEEAKVRTYFADLAIANCDQDDRLCARFASNSESTAQHVPSGTSGRFGMPCGFAEEQKPQTSQDSSPREPRQAPTEQCSPFADLPDGPRQVAELIQAAARRGGIEVGQAGIRKHLAAILELRQADCDVLRQQIEHVAMAWGRAQRNPAGALLSALSRKRGLREIQDQWTRLIREHAPKAKEVVLGAAEERRFAELWGQTADDLRSHPGLRSALREWVRARSMVPSDRDNPGFLDAMDVESKARHSLCLLLEAAIGESRLRPFLAEAEARLRDAGLKPDSLVWKRARDAQWVSVVMKLAGLG